MANSERKRRGKTRGNHSRELRKRGQSYSDTINESRCLSHEMMTNPRSYLFSECQNTRNEASLVLITGYLRFISENVLIQYL